MGSHRHLYLVLEVPQLQEILSSSYLASTLLFAHIKLYLHNGSHCQHFFCSMGSQYSSGSTQFSISRALELVRNSESGDVPPAANATLERAINDIWRRIQANPNSYIMTKDEFAVFNYHRDRFSGSDVARRAVGRFWDHFQGDGSGIDRSGPDSR